MVEAIHGGDREALRRLYERFSKYAMSVGLKIVSEQEDALDIVQDSFVSILTTIGSFEYRGEGSLRNWVARIVANHALSWLKQRNRLKFSSQLPEDTKEEEDEEETPIEKVPPDILSDMIDRLPETSRMIVNLRTFGQMSHKEIADRLGINDKTSMSHFSRARKQLAKMMKEYLNSQRI